MSLAIKSLARQSLSRGVVASAPASALRLAAVRHASSNSSSRQDPKDRAAAIINSVPSSSLASKTGTIVLGTGIAAAAISTELFVINEEVVVLGSFAILAAFIASSVRGPYNDWAEGQIEVGHRSD
jgi:F-type H+-transporting ATPase subunit b